MELSIETCTSCLTHAAINRKQALQLEFAVGLCVFLLFKGAGVEARRMLNQTYAAAGYRCITVADPDYKTINRRINVTAALYERLPVKTWVGGHAEFDAVRAVVVGLEPYEIYTVADAQRYCAPAKTTSYVRTEVRPHTDILQPVSHHSGQRQVMGMFRRASDTAKAIHVTTAHIDVVLPPTVTREELVELALKLLQLDTKELLTA